MRQETFRLTFLYALGAIAVIAPLAAAAWLAQHESLLREQDRAAAITADLLQRSDKVKNQVGRAFLELTRAPASAPCSEQRLTLMRALVIRSNMVIDIGYGPGNELICSAFGRENVSLGPPTYTAANGFIMRVGVKHPLAPQSELLVVTDPRTGNVAMVSQALIIDALPGDNSITAGMIAVTAQRVLAQRGSFNPDWLRRIGAAYDMTFYDGTNVVSWRRSRQTDYAAFAAIGRRQIEQDQHQILLTLMPIGMAAAGLLFFVLLRLARLQTSMPSLLRSALRTRKEFFLLYQPIVDLKTGHWCGAEALLRWRRPTGELISPSVFIPIAERNHLMAATSELVLVTLEQEAGKLLRSRPEFHIALNLSADDFSRPDVVVRLNALIRHMQVKPENVQVETTERVLMNVETSRSNLQRLRAAGIKVAIDDFGTGYSSLSYLHNLKADLLKIDKAFVDTIGTEAVTSEVLPHIIGMARSLNMALVAEGVETPAQADFLRAQGVEYGQGWFFARPMSMAQLLRQLRLSL